MIISVSGKIGSGKDTVGSIIQYLIDSNRFNYKISEQNYNDYLKNKHNLKSYWKIVKWADKPKDMLCIILGCTREQLEDRDFKEKELGDDWKVHKVITKLNKFNDKEIKLFVDLEQAQSYAYESFKDFDYVQLHTEILTPRKLLQLIGTECGRQIIHPNIWVNATLNNYIPNNCSESTHCALAGKPEISCKQCPEYPNWIITDTRFPNEAEAVKSRGGINIRIERDDYVFDESGKRIIPTKEYINANNKQHESETALDNYKFDYVIDNNGTIEDLIIKVKEILIKEQII